MARRAATANRRKSAAKATTVRPAPRKPAPRKSLMKRAAPKLSVAKLGKQVVVSHADPKSFKGDGLRAFFEYRDLGLMGVTGGRVHAHVVRAVPGKHADAPRHWHDLDFQFVYVLKGWAIFDYEGYGKVKLTAGSMVYQPPRIRHKEIAHSDDLELIEITSPGEFATHTAV